MLHWAGEQLSSVYGFSIQSHAPDEQGVPLLINNDLAGGNVDRARLLLLQVLLPQCHSVSVAVAV